MRGGLVRMLNLSSQDVVATFGGRRFMDRAKPFQRVADVPSRPREQEFKFWPMSDSSKAFAFPIAVQGGRSYTVYVFEESGKLEWKLVSGEPRQAVGKNAMLQVVNLLGQGVEATVEAAVGGEKASAAAKAGMQSGDIGFAATSIRVRVSAGGSEIASAEAELEPEGAYSIIVYPDPKGRPAVHVYMNNPKMIATEAGASPVG